MSTRKTFVVLIVFSRVDIFGPSVSSMAGTADDELASNSGKRKDMEDNLAEDGPGSIKKLKRMLTQEADLKVSGYF